MARHLLSSCSVFNYAGNKTSAIQKGRVQEMVKPLVAIVGRPNVGKSTFFNKVIGKRVAIVEDTPGVTRDRIYGDGTWLKYSFTMIDTGGIEPACEDIISIQMRRQAELAIETADVVVFLVDGQEGLTTSDIEVADMLRRSKKPVVLGVNKLDHQKYFNGIHDFYELGIGNPITISAEQGLGLGDLLDEVVAYFPEVDYEDENEAISIAVVGKPNVGKSSLVNALLGDERTIVSEIPGTTRDAIDSPFSYLDQNYILVDTAGIRRKRSIEDESIERYSVIRASDLLFGQFVLCEFSGRIRFLILAVQKIIAEVIILACAVHFCHCGGQRSGDDLIDVRF